MVKWGEVNSLRSVTVDCCELVVDPRFGVCMGPKGSGKRDLHPHVGWDLKAGAHERPHEETFPSGVMGVRLVANVACLAEFVGVEQPRPLTSSHTWDDPVGGQVLDDE
jgi:hypothetical protein